MFNFLERKIADSPFYNFIRYNFISELVIEFILNKNQKNIKYYSSFLEKKDNDLIFDVGANKGNKVKAYCSLGYRVIAIEPEIKSIETINYRFSNSKVIILPIGLSNESGFLNLNIFNSRSGFNTISDKWKSSILSNFNGEIQVKETCKVEISTLDNVFKKFGKPYYIKIDVEGHELNVIKGMSKFPDIISFEANIPDFLDETIEIINYLTKNHIQGICQFKYAINDKLISNSWISDFELVNILKSTNKEKVCFEIICKFVS